MMVENMVDPLTSLLRENTGDDNNVPPAEGGRILCGELPIRIDREGLWFYHGTPINRQELVKLFASAMERDDEGRYWLITPQEMGEIEVEDAPFLGVELFVSGEGEDQIITLRTNMDDRVTLDLGHALRITTHPETGEPRPYVEVRPGLEARLVRPVYYELVDLGVETQVDDRPILGIWSSGIYFQIGRLEED